MQKNKRHSLNNNDTRRKIMKEKEIVVRTADPDMILPDKIARRRKPGSRVAKKFYTVVEVKDGKLVAVYGTRPDSVVAIVNHSDDGTGFVFEKDNTDPDNKEVTLSRNVKAFMEKLKTNLELGRIFLLD